MSKRTLRKQQLANAVNTAIANLAAHAHVAEVITLGQCDPLATDHPVTAAHGYPALLHTTKTQFDLMFPHGTPKADCGENGVAQGYFVSVAMDGKTVAVLVLRSPISKSLLKDMNCGLSLVPKHHTASNTTDADAVIEEKEKAGEQVMA